jgi:hypothetical protein
MNGSEIKRATAPGTGRGVAEAVAAATGHGLATDEAVVGEVLSDATLVTESIGAGPRDGDRACRSRSNKREGDRQCGGNNCKGLHDCVSFRLSPFRSRKAVGNHRTYTPLWGVTSITGCSNFIAYGC